MGWVFEPTNERWRAVAAAKVSTKLARILDLKIDSRKAWTGNEPGMINCAENY
jgi:hypothetical protein